MKYKTRSAAARRRRGQRGASIFEAMLAICILFFVLFALLQIYHWCMSRMFCQYAAFYSSKALALGYRPNLALRAARVAAISISGPNDGRRSGDAETDASNYMVNGDASGVRYRYWHQTVADSPLLTLGGNTRNDSFFSTIRLRNAPLIEDGALARLLDVRTNPEPAATVDSYNYSQLYLEE